VGVTSAFPGLRPFEPRTLLYCCNSPRDVEWKRKMKNPRPNSHPRKNTSKHCTTIYYYLESIDKPYIYSVNQNGIMQNNFKREGIWWFGGNPLPARKSERDEVEDRKQCRFPGYFNTFIAFS